MSSAVRVMVFLSCMVEWVSPPVDFIAEIASKEIGKCIFYRIPSERQANSANKRGGLTALEGFFFGKLTFPLGVLDSYNPESVVDKPLLDKNNNFFMINKFFLLNT